MLKNTHTAAGMCAGFALAAVYTAPPLTAAAIVVEATIGSLLPDIDHKDSFISKKLRPVGWAARIFFGHRSFFHSVFVYAAVFAALWFWRQPLAVSLLPLFAGIASHLFLDALNPAGIPLLFKRRVHLARIYTGSGAENFLRFLLCVAEIGLSGYYVVMRNLLTTPF